MAAVVLAFQAPKPQPQRPWQNHELAELYRAVDILGRAGLAVATDMGISDEGDPWFAFYRTDTGDVIVHCARISGVFIASSIAINQTFSGANFREVIDSIVRYQPLGIPVTTTSTQLFLHPIMVLAAFVATALLCSKNADAHDLHTAVVSLAPSEAPAGHKGLAALKAAVSELLGMGSHINADAGKVSDLVAANAEPIPLAAFMAAALTIVKPSFDAVAQTLTVSDSAAIIVADQSHAAPQPAAPSVLLNANQDTAIVQSDVVASAAAAVGVPAIDWAKFGDLKLTFQGALLSDHMAPASQTDAGATAPGVGTGNSESVLLAPQFDHFVLRHVQNASGTVISTAVATATAATAAATADQGSTATTQAAPDFIHQAAADFGIVTSVALSVLLGAPEAQPQAADALTLISHSTSHADSTSASSLASLLASGASSGVSTDTTSASLAVSPSPAVVSTAADTAAPASTISGTDVTSMVTQAAAALSSSAVAPTTIVLAEDPVTGLAQLANYAVSNHPISGPVVVAPDLAAAISTYTSQIAHSATLVVFDSSSVKLPFFEFIKGVIFVDDQELGITPNQAELANAVTVDLAAGSGTMKLLGVLDTGHLPVTGGA